MHNALVTTAGEKMSKSLDNSALVSEVIKRFPARAVRLYLIQPHYRSPIEYSDAAIAESVAALGRIDNFVDRATERVGSSRPPEVPEEFIAAMNDDLGTPAAVAVLHNAVREGNQALDAGDRDQIASRLSEVNGMLMILGLNADSEAWRPRDDHHLTAVVDGLINELLKQRAAARDRKDFAAADAIRSSLTALGVEVSDTPVGTRWSLHADLSESSNATARLDSDKSAKELG
jgi:cysteinyl-tRNA synthetase